MGGGLFETSGAEFSPCRTWRYRLWREWEPGGRALVMIMLNPSTADEVENDATIERCERRARNGGFSSLQVFNIFAFRATDPADMKAAADPVGPDNDDHLTLLFAEASRNAILRQGHPPMFCAGWGVHGSFAERDRQVQGLADRHGARLMCLGTTKDGQPRHPLYVSYDQPFVPWAAPGR